MSLLLNLNNSFYVDWYGNIWMFAYTSEFFRNHLNFPEVFNTQYVGYPNPIFLWLPVLSVRRHRRVPNAREHRTTFC